jgi:hypothetical protein
MAALCLGFGQARAQVTVTPADVRNALEELREAPAYERSDKRQDVVKMGELAVDPLIEVVQAHREAGDANFVGQAIIALGELKAERATDPLTDVLGSTNLQLVYLAAAALGEVWEGKGGQEEAREANAALMGALLADAPPVAAYGPALALVKINGIPVQRPESQEADALAQEIAAWFSANTAALPPAQERPWLVNVYMIFSTQEVAERRAAIEALRQERSLAPVATIASALADEQSVAGALRGELGTLLGELTGVPFPPEGLPTDASAAEQVYAWKWDWLDELRRNSDEKHVRYAWQQLERTLRSYSNSPSEEAAEEVKYYRAALISQLPNLDALPRTASSGVRELLKAPLSIKSKMADAVEQLEREPGDFEKLTQLEIVLEEADREFGKEVGLLFLGRLYALAYEEVNLNIAKQYGAALTKISTIPCDMSAVSLDGRRERLDRWRDEVTDAGIVLEVPAE